MLSLLHLFFLQAGVEVCLAQAASGLFIVGGLSKIFLTDQTSSPLLSAVELFGCSGGPIALPDYPREVFGASLYWYQSSLLVCGGADWREVTALCFLWNSRFVSLPIVLVPETIHAFLFHFN